MLPTNEEIPYKRRPDSEYRYFVYDPVEGLMFYYKSKEEQLEAAREVIEDCKKDDWNYWMEEVEELLMGEITHITVEKVLEHRPERENYTSEQAFNDAMEEWPYGDEVDSVSDFVICPIGGNHDSL